MPSSNNDQSNQNDKFSLFTRKRLSLGIEAFIADPGELTALRNSEKINAIQIEQQKKAISLFFDASRGSSQKTQTFYKKLKEAVRNRTEKTVSGVDPKNSARHLSSRKIVSAERQLLREAIIDVVSSSTGVQGLLSCLTEYEKSLLEVEGLVKIAAYKEKAAEIVVMQAQEKAVRKVEKAKKASKEVVIKAQEKAEREAIEVAEIAAIEAQKKAVRKSKEVVIKAQKKAERAAIEKAGKVVEKN